MLTVPDLAKKLGVTRRHMLRLASNVPGLQPPSGGQHWRRFDDSCEEFRDWFAAQKDERKRERARKRGKNNLGVKVQQGIGSSITRWKQWKTAVENGRASFDLRASKKMTAELFEWLKLLHTLDEKDPKLARKLFVPTNAIVRLQASLRASGGG